MADNNMTTTEDAAAVVDRPSRASRQTTAATLTISGTGAATRSSSRLRTQSKSSRKTTTTTTTAPEDEITPARRTRRKRRSTKTATPPPAAAPQKKKPRTKTGAVVKVQAATNVAPATTDAVAGESNGTSSSLLCGRGGFSIDTILSDEDEVETFNKLFRVKSAAELEIATASIVKANTTKKSSGRNTRGSEKKVQTTVPLHYEQKNRKVALTLQPAQMDADLIEILGRTPEAFDPHRTASPPSPPSQPVRKTRSRKTTGGGGGAAKKTKSANPDVDRYFKPHPEWKGYITCVSCGQTQWPPNREKHLPKCVALHPELAAAAAK